jgi:hypothetical protein
MALCLFWASFNMVAREGLRLGTMIQNQYLLLTLRLIWKKRQHTIQSKSKPPCYKQCWKITGTEDSKYPRC